MAASAEFVIGNGPSGTLTTLGSSGNLQDFKNIDTAGIADYAANPITAGQNSFECWFKLHLFGSFTTVRDLRFWQSVDHSPNTGLQVFYKSNNQTSYVQPVATTSTVATSSVPTADPGTTNFSIGGSLSSSLASAGYSDFLVLQLRTSAIAPGGDTSLSAYVVSYFEN